MKKVLCSRCKQRPAVVFISKIVDGKAEPEGLCIKCAMKLNIGPMQQMLSSMGITSEQDVDAISDDIENMLDSMSDGLDDDGEQDDGDFEPGGSTAVPFIKSLFTPPDGSAAGAQQSKNDDSSKVRPNGSRQQERKNEKDRKFLNLYCTNLTQRARDGEIDNIVGRDREIERMIQILCRRSKNNPCLIGEPGVGKTAIAEGIALRIAAGNVPAKLALKEIHLLDLTSLVAGTQFRGQFEGRIKSLISEVKKDGNIILFIDEVHTLVGTGDAEGSMNAANILKPALSRGEIQVIGATTFTEYRKHIEKDAALERRFQPIKVDEPSVEDACKILLGIKRYYETYHRVSVSPEIVRSAVVLSERYINDRFLPDKAIDLLDEACTRANLKNPAISELELNEQRIRQLNAANESLLSESEIDYEQVAKTRTEIIKCENKTEQLRQLASNNAVDEDDLAHVIELWTGIPASKIVESDYTRLADLENTLKSKIIGQDEAVRAVSAAIKRSRVHISPRRRPASFIFVGPTGVGKTELVKRLAAELFDTPETLIRLDMSEFMEKHSVSRIIGSPPGYVGYDEAGQLTEKVRRKPYSVILFDEIEKAHPDVMNILLQILDEGRITDAQGRVVSFENTVIVMTSNAGSTDKSGALGFGKEKSVATREKVMKALSDFLRPEFIGRVDEVVVFNPLSRHDYERIAALLIDELKSSLEEKSIKLSYRDDVCAYLAEKSENGTRGARDLCVLIRREIEDKIAELIIQSAGKTSGIDVSVSEDRSGLELCSI